MSEFCKNGHERNQANHWRDRRGWKRCRACDRDNDARRRLKGGARQAKPKSCGCPGRGPCRAECPQAIRQKEALARGKKICSACGEEKAVGRADPKENGFYKPADGECKRCLVRRATAWNRRNPEAHLKATKKHYRKKTNWKPGTCRFCDSEIPEKKRTACYCDREECRRQRRAMFWKPYYERNKAELAERKKAWEREHTEYRKNYRRKNRDRDRARQRSWRELNRELCRKIQQEWRRAFPEKVKSYRLVACYGITLDDYFTLLESQSGVCQICGILAKPVRGGWTNLVVDLDHTTGRTRGLLCRPCNMLLARADADSNWPRLALSYVDRVPPQLAADTGADPSWGAETRKKEAALRQKFGLGFAQYEDLRERQGGVCAICSNAETAKRDGKVLALALDHDHESLAARGLLCLSCNLAIGVFDLNKSVRLSIPDRVEKYRG
jgi:hypothetical protein